MAKAKKAAKKPAKKAPAKAGGVSKNYVDTKFKSLQQQVCPKEGESSFPNSRHKELNLAFGNF